MYIHDLCSDSVCGVHIIPRVSIDPAAPFFSDFGERQKEQL